MNTGTGSLREPQELSRMSPVQQAAMRAASAAQAPGYQQRQQLGICRLCAQRVWTHLAWLLVERDQGAHAKGIVHAS